MLPVVTPAQVKELDARALEREELADIIGCVGDVIAHEVIRILGGTYGRRVNVLIGPGLNGADAASAARRLERRGVRVRRIPLQELPAVLPPADLTVDGLFGIGLNRPFEAPDPGATPVIAVDIPSGIDGLTGQVLGVGVRADITLALMALKPGLLLGDGPSYAGDVRVLDIGLPVDEQQCHLVEDRDVHEWLPQRSRHAHKWNHAVLVIAGSPSMTGASHLVCRGALRAGAGYVHLDSAAPVDPGVPTEVVASLAGKGVRMDAERFSALVVGPGLGNTAPARAFVRTVLETVPLPAVVDGDGLSAVADHFDVLSGSETPTILTPHDGEYERLMGERPGADRLAAARALASRASSIVLLKGPTTVVASPQGRTLLCSTGDARLATAGTGDVLAGMIGAFLARGIPPFHAAAAAAHVHGRAAALGPNTGLIASDLPDLIPNAINQLAPHCEVVGHSASNTSAIGSQ